MFCNSYTSNLPQFPQIYEKQPTAFLPDDLDALTSSTKGLCLDGTPVSAGWVKGVARIVSSLEHANELKAGEILVCPSTDVGWTPYFALAGGLVTEIGMCVFMFMCFARF
jgi:phosphoenolpyruvate synthase/pyruvate phosphate dikinase